MKWYKPSEKLPEEDRVVILATNHKGRGYSEIDTMFAELDSYVSSGEKCWCEAQECRVFPISESDRWAYIELPDSFEPEKEPEKEGFDWSKVTMDTIIKHKEYGYGLVELVNMVDVGVFGEWHSLEKENTCAKHYKPALIWRTEDGKRKGVLLTADTLKDFEKIGKWGPDDFPKDAERSFYRGARNMTVKEYKDWLAIRNKEYADILGTWGSMEEFNTGKASAFKECFDKCPDSFEPDTKLQVDSAAVAAETAYVMRKIEELRKDMDSKTQSNTDKIDNLKKQLKESKERAENGWERVRYLERKLRDVESLNDQLLRELARRQCKEEMEE